MDKAFEKFLEGLPRPIILGVVALIAWAWALKELKEYDSYGEVFKDTAFLIISAVIILFIFAYYGFTFLKSRLTSKFATNERGVFVARFEGDSEDRVQTHTTESLKLAIFNHDSLTDVRVRKADRLIKGHPEACSLAENGLAKLCVWGVFIPPKIVHYKLSSPSENREAHAMIPDFEKGISLIEDEVVDFLSSIPPSKDSPQERIKFLEKQVEKQKSVIENDAKTIAGLNEKLHSIEHPVVAAEHASQLREKEVERQRRRVVLAAGISEYQAFPSLRSPKNDARAISDLVSGRWKNSEVRILTNTEATKGNIEKELWRIASEVQKNDQVWFYYSGHAITDQRGDGYILPHDGNPRFLRSSAISMKEIGNWFQELLARQAIVFVDACYSGAFSRILPKGTSTQLESNKDGYGRVIITAGGESDFAYEDQNLEQGVFTHFLLKGLSGHADLNNDGIVTATEIYEYLQKNVSSASKSAGFRQSPQMWSQDIAGDFVLSIVD